MLCASIGWVNHKRKELIQKGIKEEFMDINSEKVVKNIQIYYSSRTHSQLTNVFYSIIKHQVIKEIKKTCYFPETTVLSSRENSCVNDLIRTSAKSKGSLNNECQKVRKINACNYFSNPMTKKGEDNSMIDIEELVLKGKKQYFCPFYFSRSKIQTSDIVFLPYNYIFDENISSVMDFDLKNNILVVDEGHNLESVCEEGSSITCSASNLNDAYLELQNFLLVAEKAVKVKGEKEILPPSRIESLMSIVENIKLYIQRLEIRDNNNFINANGFGFNSNIGKKLSPKELFDVFFEGSKKVSDQKKLKNSLTPDGITPDNFKLFIDDLTNIEHSINDMLGTNSSQVLSEIIRLFSLIYKLYFNHKDCIDKNELQTEKSLLNSYRILIQDSEIKDISKSNNKKKKSVINNGKERLLYILCLNPGLRLNQVINESKPLSFILTSGKTSI